jgi:hypothetical protein
MYKNKEEKPDSHISNFFEKMPKTTDAQKISKTPKTPSKTPQSKKRYVVVSEDGKRLSGGVYHGKGPFQAASKAAGRLIRSGDAKEVEFRMREVSGKGDSNPNKTIRKYSAKSVTLKPEEATYLIPGKGDDSKKRKRIGYDEYKKLDDDEKKKVVCYRRKTSVKIVKDTAKPKTEPKKKEPRKRRKTANKKEEVEKVKNDSDDEESDNDDE